MLVTSQTELPKVVSSCYRAGNWEWVKQTLCRTKDPSPLKGKKHVHFRKSSHRTLNTTTWKCK